MQLIYTVLRLQERERNPCQSSRRHRRAQSVCSISNHTARILLCIFRMTQVDSAQAWFMPWKVQGISHNHDICATKIGVLLSSWGKMQGNGQFKNLRICENIDISYIHSESVSSSYWPKWGGKELKEWTSLVSSNKGISVHKT